MRLQCCLAKYREMQRNAKKCREMQRNAEKCREKQRNAEKCIRNSEKCWELLQKWEMKRNVWKCRYAEISSWPSWPLWPSWHTGMWYLISLNPMHLQNTAHVRSYRNLKNLVEISKMTRFFWENFPKLLNPLTNPGVFVRFGNTKGEIQVKKRRIWVFFLGGGNQPPHPPNFGKVVPKRNFHFLDLP